MCVLHTAHGGEGCICSCVCMCTCKCICMSMRVEAGGQHHGPHMWLCHPVLGFAVACHCSPSSSVAATDSSLGPQSCTQALQCLSSLPGPLWDSFSPLLTLPALWGAQGTCFPVSNRAWSPWFPFIGFSLAGDGWFGGAASWWPENRFF